MESLDKQGALRMMTLFSGAVKGLGFYPPSHPSIRQPLMELDKIIAGALTRSERISWGIIDGIMFFDNHLFTTPSTTIADFSNRLAEKEIGRIIISAGLTFDELQAFVGLLSDRHSSFESISSGVKNPAAHICLVRMGEEQFADGSPTEKSDDETGGEGNFAATYGKALQAIRDICRDIELGRIPSSAPVIGVVDRMASITMQDPSTLLGLTMIKDYDNYTFNHCVNVGILAMALGASLGLDSISVKQLGIAGHLHDIGKTMISKTILNKPGRLSSVEFDEMKRHSDLGAKIVREMDGIDPHISQIVLGHHLHYNRSGYPQWATSLPFNNLIDIVAIADTYDAITTLRVYQKPVNPRTALHEMQKLMGTILDSALTRSFMELLGKYPVGTLVRLDTNELAVVHRPNHEDAEAPTVKIVADKNGKRFSTGREQSLAEQDGLRYARIVAEVDPLMKNIDVGKLLTSGNY